MIIGTAGHIDHGKTSLIGRLTGRDTDRLPEEKRRGISIELGYAYLSIDGLQNREAKRLGFIDVPGHEKFVHSMLSGATGIDYALLVIAADDGPMPQTREHLDILRLLGVQQGAVVVTKIDRVDAAIGDQTIAAIASMVAGQPAEHWPLFPVSSVSGEGIAELLEHLRIKASEFDYRSAGGMFRLAVDRAFTLQGLGTIVTGTAHSGVVRIGDALSLMPSGVSARVRSIHSQDQAAEEGRVGERLALNLAGISVESVRRGEWLVGSGLTNRASRFDAQLESSSHHDRTITQGLEVHLHHGSSDVMAKLYPLEQDRLESGSSGLVHLQLAAPISLCKADRFVIRDSQARLTLGGGSVLDIAPPARGRRSLGRLSTLQALRDLSPASALTQMILSAPMSLESLRHGWNLQEAELGTLVTQSGAVVAGGVAFHPSRWLDYRDRILEVIDQTHIREPEMPGLELNRLRRVAAPQLSQDAYSELIEALAAQALVVQRGVFVGRPSHKAELSVAEKNLWKSIAPLLNETPYNPPRVRDIANLVHIPETEIRANLRKVARVGEVTLVALDHFFLTPRVSEMAEIVLEIFQAQGTVRAADFRDRIGGGRKVAIQILEFFDRIGFTRRLRDEHLVRRSNPYAELTQEAQSA
jgi:selenocysteine-specific elongation factor